jgi:N-acetylglucosaminyldiphosphoundecaprenol N-acetyl-beta-D-mannosaminyltransferase
MINGVASGLICVGTINPGFGAVDAMSGDDIIDTVNSSGADLLAVSLGAEKGQAWLHRNPQAPHHPGPRPSRRDNQFFGRGVKRAPRGLQRLGLEWPWRIKEEPYLWRRYAHDGLLLSRAPTACNHKPMARAHIQAETGGTVLIITERYHDSVTIKVFGDANRRTIGKAIACFQETLTKWHATVVIDLGGARVIDERFLGLLTDGPEILEGAGGEPEVHRGVVCDAEAILA